MDCRASQSQPGLRHVKSIMLVPWSILQLMPVQSSWKLLNNKGWQFPVLFL